jgi:CO/xanthine dehydrogenase Mo-binding subunit/CO/xanthine dehydrogenase FAD-binding subunit
LATPDLTTDLTTLPDVLAEPGLIGTSVRRLDGIDKTTGRAQYVADVRLPRMLYGAVVRSPHAHARVLSVDTSRARRLPGVHAVITSADHAHRKWGAFRPDLYPLAVDKVRYVGDEVAAVAATDPDTAREAAALIEVDYEPLPAVLDLDSALADGAPLVHDDAERNTAHHFNLERGDVDGWLARSDVVVEGTWETARQWHSSIETIGCVADWSPDGRVTLWVNTQTPFLARQRYATALDVAERHVRVIQTEVGGGFGGKSGDDNCSVICALLSRAAGRPVQLVLSREEEFLASRPRIPMRYDVTLGFTRDGLVTAKDLRVLADNGAYTGKAQAVLGAATVRHDAIYKYKAVRADSRLVYTNLVPTGAFRGFGNPSADWAVGQAWDLAAHELGIDVVDLMLRNAVEPGWVSPHNHKIGSCELKQCIEKAADLIGWREKKARPLPNRGLAIGASVHVSGRRSFGDWDGSSAIVRMNEDGRATVIVGEGEIGTGARTTLCQIAAASIGLPIEDVDMSKPDTDIATHALGALASRVTYVAGNAVRDAALAARRKLVDGTAERTGIPAAELDVVDGVLVAPAVDPDLRIPVGAAVRKLIYRPGGEPIVGVGSFDNPSDFPDESRYGNESGAYNFVAEAAEVEVDPYTGAVRIVELAAVADCGTVLNPALAQGQVEGAVAQGIGLAMTEWFAGPAAEPDRANYVDYKLPTAGVMPRLHVAFADSYEPTGPFGAKGVGEIALDPVPAIVASAIADAVGVRIHELPITAEKIYWALHPDKCAGMTPHEPRGSQPHPRRTGRDPATSTCRTEPRRSKATTRVDRGEAELPSIVAPADLAGAIDLLAGSAVPVGGGVGLTLARRAAGRPAADTLVPVAGLLRGIEAGETELRIGAGERLDAIAAHPAIRSQWTVVAEAAGSVATGRIRRSVTLGGNVAAFDPTHDPPVALVAAGARVVLASAGGERVSDLAGLSALGAGELLREFRLPRPGRRTGSAYEKFLVRGVWEYACVSVAAVVAIGERHTTVRLAVGSVRGAPLLVPADVEVLDEAAISDLAERAAEQAEPWSDVRGSAAYKRRMIAVFGARALRNALRRAERGAAA